MELRALIAAALMLGTLAAPEAQARFIRFDLGGNWEDPNFLDLAGDGSFTVDNMGFEIDFGLGPTRAITIHENGFVTFDDFAGDQRITLFEDASFDFESSIPASGEDETPGALTYSRGVFDFNGSFGSDPTDAFRVSWYDPDADTAFQLVLRTEDLSDPGEFLLEFNYGCDPSRQAGCTLASVGNSDSTAGLTLGTNGFSASGPFLTAQNYDFRFEDGALVAAPTAVPEPGSLGLMAGGLMLLSLLYRRWRLRMEVSASTRLRPLVTAFS